MTMTFRGKIDTSCDIEYKLQYRNIAISYDTDLNIGIFQLLLYRFQHRSIVTSKFPTAKKVAIKKNWRHWAHKTQNEDKQNK